MEKRKIYHTGNYQILLAFFIDEYLLEIPANLSKSFQDDKIDPVHAMQCLNKAQGRFDMFEQKKFEKLPHVKDFLRQVEERDGNFYYQDIKLPSFETAKESIKAKKSFFCEKVSACITERLEQEVDSEKIFQVAPQILNTEGWIRRKEEDDNKVQDYEFMDEGIEELVKHFEIPLRNAGFNSTIPELLKQWHELLEYGTEYLSLPYTPYRVTWRRIFTSPRSQTWKDLLILVELLFTIPVSNAKLERMFSKMKHVKTLFRASLSEHRLESILCIIEDGPNFLDYNPMSAIKLWANDKVRRPYQKVRTYKKRESVKRKLSSLSDSDTASEDEEQTIETSLFDNED